MSLPGATASTRSKFASRVKGFNALFTTASIEAAKRYYTEFAKQQQALAPDRRPDLLLRAERS